MVISMESPCSSATEESSISTTTGTEIVSHEEVQSCGTTSQDQGTCPVIMDATIEQQLKDETESKVLPQAIKNFEPRIIAFCCNWCSYAGADLAGVSRLQYPPNVKIIRVLCSGRIEPDFVLRALELGADGVLVAGCHPGDCHYISGNLKAEKRFKMLTNLLQLLGVDTRRARLEWISASEGPKFAATMSEFVDQLKELGPNNLKKKRE